MSQIPHLLSACISHSAGEDRLTLLTSVLGASTNWLVLRFLQSFLHHGGSKKATAVGDEDAPLGQDDVSVVLVSFLRDMAFWKDSAKKLVCVHRPS
jgi:elongator complex protein 6